MKEQRSCIAAIRGCGWEVEINRQEKNKLAERGVPASQKEKWFMNVKRIGSP
jgi:hypothetical protein